MFRFSRFSDDVDINTHAHTQRRYTITPQYTFIVMVEFFTFEQYVPIIINMNHRIIGCLVEKNNNYNNYKKSTNGR